MLSQAHKPDFVCQCLKSAAYWVSNAEGNTGHTFWKCPEGFHGSGPACKTWEVGVPPHSLACCCLLLPAGVFCLSCCVAAGDSPCQLSVPVQMHAVSICAEEPVHAQWDDKLPEEIQRPRTRNRFRG